MSRFHPDPRTGRFGRRKLLGLGGATAVAAVAPLAGQGGQTQNVASVQSQQISTASLTVNESAQAVAAPLRIYSGVPAPAGVNLAEWYDSSAALQAYVDRVGSLFGVKNIGVVAAANDLNAQVFLSAGLFPLISWGAGGASGPDVYIKRLGTGVLGILGGFGYSIFALTDAATVATDCSKGNIFTLAATAGRTIGAPTNAQAGGIVTYDILNSSGGAMVTTWNAVFNLAGAWVDPANTKHRLISFYCTDGTNFREVSRTAADST